MNKKALVALLLLTLFVTTLAFTVKPARATAYAVHFTLPFPNNSLYNIINSGPPFAPGDHIHILAGHVETLPSSLFITFPNLFIIGAPTGGTPSIDLAGRTILINAPGVSVYGLDFYDSTGTSSTCIWLIPTASNCTIRACSLRGSLVPSSIGIWINASTSFIACNMISGWGTGIYICGPQSNGNLIKLNNISYNMMLPPTAYGVQVGWGAGAANPNRVCWNNIFAHPNNSLGMGQELWDPTPSNPLNLFDSFGLLPFNFSKGNYESSWAVPPPYSVAGPGMNGWFDHFPLTAPISPITGDINLDGMVDIFDAILLANAFGKQWCDAKWDPRVDLKPDGSIDIFDAIMLANSFAKHY